MTTSRTTAERCDRILALIDGCLADIAADAPGRSGSQRRPPTRRPTGPRHLTVVRT